MSAENIISTAIISKFSEKLIDGLKLDVALVGGGPSALVAARYLAEAGLKTAVFERKLAPGGGTWGGGMLFNEVVVQDEALDILDDFNITHKKLENAVDDKIQKFGKCLIIDCHSFSGTPLPYEPQQDSMRPSFCLGTLDAHTPQHLIDVAVNALKSPEHSVELNYPYAGSMIPLKYFNDQRVKTIMVEINRTLYQKQGCLLPTQNYNSIKNKISSLLKLLTSSF